MMYSEILNPKLKAVIDGLKYNTYSVMVDIQQALYEAGNESEFIEDAIASMNNLRDEIEGLTRELRLAGGMKDE
jgi:hypothetical protein